MNLKKFKIEKISLLVLIFFIVIIFFLFRSLFNSYFEADEWVHFTYYLPLAGKPGSLLTALLATLVNTGFLTGEGQHINPIATTIFFLNTKFFDISFPPYAFMSLLFHSINTFLVFLFIKSLLHEKKIITRNIFAILGGIFFALAPTPIHTVTGAAPFYSYNILSVTFFLLCVISFKIAFIKKQKKFIYGSVIFLFLALFSKETTVFLFLILPFMALIEKRIFPLKFLGKVFALCAGVYIIFRFIIPNLNTLPEKIIDVVLQGYIPKSYTQQNPAVDTGTIVSRDLSIYKNLPAEILFRAITFPVKMTGTLFLPRQTVFSIVQFITPIVQPVPPGGDSADSSQARLGFLYGPGNGFIIYIASIIILIFCASQIFRFVARRQMQDAQAVATGLAIIIFSALPLVAIIFSFPRWGTDFYFDSRHYYNPNVGAAIVFPFLLLGVAEFISKSLRIKAVSLVAIVLSIVWLINNMNVFNLGIKQFTQNFQPDRREVVEQLKKYVPALPKIAVFYVETDGLSAYGPSLPFQTSVPQALTVVYYDKNPLPDSFFEKAIFDGRSQGYSYSEGRGFGYYTSKKKLSEALVAHEFKLSDIYAFYYDSMNVRLSNTTSQVRKEMENYLKQTKVSLDWRKFNDSSDNFSFLYPPQTIINEIKEEELQNVYKSFSLDNPSFTAKIIVFNITPTFNVNDYLQIRSQGKLGIVNSKKVSYDKFHYNDAYVINDNQTREYLIKFDDKLVQLETQSMDQESLQIIEKIAGSLEVLK